MLYDDAKRKIEQSLSDVFCRIMRSLYGTEVNRSFTRLVRQAMSTGDAKTYDSLKGFYENSENYNGNLLEITYADVTIIRYFLLHDHILNLFSRLTGFQVSKIKFLCDKRNAYAHRSANKGDISFDEYNDVCSAADTLVKSIESSISTGTFSGTGSGHTATQRNTVRSAAGVNIPNSQGSQYNSSDAGGQKFNVPISGSYAVWTHIFSAVMGYSSYRFFVREYASAISNSPSFFSFALAHPEIIPISILLLIQILGVSCHIFRWNEGSFFQSLIFSVSIVYCLRSLYSRFNPLESGSFLFVLVMFGVMAAYFLASFFILKLKYGNLEQKKKEENYTRKPKKERIPKGQRGRREKYNSQKTPKERKSKKKDAARKPLEETISYPFKRNILDQLDKYAGFILDAKSLLQVADGKEREILDAYIYNYDLLITKISDMVFSGTLFKGDDVRLRKEIIKLTDKIKKNSATQKYNKLKKTLKKRLKKSKRSSHEDSGVSEQAAAECVAQALAAADKDKTFLEEPHNHDEHSSSGINTSCAGSESDTSEAPSSSESVFTDTKTTESQGKKGEEEGEAFLSYRIRTELKNTFENNCLYKSIDDISAPINNGSDSVLYRTVSLNKDLREEAEWENGFESKAFDYVSFCQYTGSAFGDDLSSDDTKRVEEACAKLAQMVFGTHQNVKIVSTKKSALLQEKNRNEKLIEIMSMELDEMEKERDFQKQVNEKLSFI